MSAVGSCDFHGGAGSADCRDRGTLDPRIDHLIEAVRDLAVSRLDEPDGLRPVVLVSREISWHRRCGEVVERGEELGNRIVMADQVLQEKEVNVALKVLEQAKEARIPEERFLKRARCAFVVPTDAFKYQVESIANLLMHAARTIDRRLPIDPIAREENRPADRATDAMERRSVLDVHLSDDVHHPNP
ncbi:hypothetical protein [Cryobacterium sp. Hb1]|uniref:hypothetical protein n=1 Tax=Cryobacterium sp. Hb1 TaxID=1259147 RepID=UPI00141ACD96|nr:hypothetical protein [Cryobacterium sp. Hb1]